MNQSTSLLATAIATSVFNVIVRTGIPTGGSPGATEKCLSLMVVGVNAGFYNLNKDISVEDVNEVVLKVYGGNVDHTSQDDVKFASWNFKTSRQTNTQCEVCAGWQVESPSGITCEAGHGGAGSMVFPDEFDIHAVRLKEDGVCPQCHKELLAHSIITVHGRTPFCSVACIEAFNPKINGGTHDPI